VAKHTRRELFEHQDEFRVALDEVLYGIRTREALPASAERDVCLQRNLLGHFDVNASR
jgi:hypothetical protein